jgi:glyoxylate reductase
MPQPKVFVSLKHPGNAIDHLSKHAEVVKTDSPEPVSEDVLHKNLEGKDGCVVILQDRFDDAVFSKFPELKVVANVAVGYDNIDVAAATKHGVLVLNTPGVLDNTTADLAFGLLLSVARRISEADRYVRDGKWKKWTFDLILGTDVGGKTIGIIGLGRIGQAMARRAKGFGMKILYTQRNPAKASIEEEVGAKFVDMAELLAESDFVSIHCPLSTETTHLIGMKELNQMKKGAFLINTARGAIVDEKALVKVLKSGRIAGAGLDVFEDEPNPHPFLLHMENVVLAPHIGSGSIETRSAMARLAVDGLLSAFDEKLPANAVNPEVWKTFTSRLWQVC